MFFDDVIVESVYGSFPGSRLSGGRNNAGEAWPIEFVRARIERYNSLGVGCNVTFSNQFVDGDSLEENPFDKEILESLACGSGNGVILYSDELARSIRATFPSLVLIASTTKGLRTVEETDDACGIYHRVVLDYNHSKDEAFFAGLSHPQKAEVMVNEYCTLGCAYRDDHYRAVSEAQLRGEEADFPCHNAMVPQAYGFLNGLVEGDVFLRNADIRRYHDKFSIGSFKIVGRGLSRYDVVDSYLYYLIKPEFWYEIRDFMIHHDFF